MQRLWLLLLLCVACGARSEIAGSGGELDDASATQSLDASGFDVSSTGDGASDGDASCTPAQIDIGCAGPPTSPDCEKYGCKFGVEWKCGDKSFTVGGSCTPPDAGSPSSDGIVQGACREDGSQTSTFTVDTTTCDCKKDQSIVTLVEGLCTHQ